MVTVPLFATAYLRWSTNTFRSRLDRGWRRLFAGYRRIHRNGSMGDPRIGSLTPAMVNVTGKPTESLGFQTVPLPTAK